MARRVGDTNYSEREDRLKAQREEEKAKRKAAEATRKVEEAKNRELRKKLEQSKK